MGIDDQSDVTVLPMNTSDILDFSDPGSIGISLEDNDTLLSDGELIDTVQYHGPGGLLVR